MSKPLSVKDLRAGDTVKLNITTDVFSAQESYPVWIRNRYDQGGFEWFEVGLRDKLGGLLWLEWAEDDELEIRLNIQKITLGRLGLTRRRISKFEKKGAGFFNYKDIEYEYVRSGDAVFYRNCTRPAYRFHYWDFRDEIQKHFACVERWSTWEYESFTGIFLAESNIEVIRPDATS